MTNAKDSPPKDTRPRTYVYVDGFNLYYGGLRGTRDKWLNLRALLERVMSKNRIEKIWYFTARVKARDGDRREPIRQQTYIRALETLSGLEVEYGFFRREIRELRRADDMGTLQVWLPREKGSDVNLATQLMDDFCNGRFEAASVLSNDSDLVAPIKIINAQRSRPVGLMTPPKWKNTPAVELRTVAAFHHRITMAAVRDCQFPEELLAQDGQTLRRPDGW